MVAMDISWNQRYVQSLHVIGLNFTFLYDFIFYGDSMIYEQKAFE